MNLFADMGVQPATLQSGLAAATRSTDSTPPTATITTPGAGKSLQAGVPVTISGTAADSGGGVVAGVEVSVDGSTWHPATGRENWTYTWTPSVAGDVTVRVRAVDDSGNLGPPPPGGAAAPPAGGAGAGAVGASSSSAGAVDRRAPRVSVSPRRVRLSRSGRVTVRVRCPKSETRCRVTLTLKVGRRSVASTTLTVRGGSSRIAVLRLSAWARRRLQVSRTLRITAVARARDQSGNAATTTTHLQLLAPRRHA